MNNVLMYCHNGSKNHGCEAIIRSTVGILDRTVPMQYYQISRNMAEDKDYGIHQLVNLLPEYAEVPHGEKGFLTAYMVQRLLHKPEKMNYLSSLQSFCAPHGPTVSLSIGGDNYCYKGYKLYCGYHQTSRQLGHKTVLWGCSVEPKFLDYDGLLDDLQTFDKIVTRESISYQAMYDKGLRNLVLYPDPAFTLKADPFATVLPPENTVGINISPMALGYASEHSDVMGNYEELIRYILRDTDMNIALVPHVIWDGNDDRIVLKKLKDSFPKEDRIFVVDDMDATKLKAYISHLRFFVGARTHATIAAYSTGVPTLVAGYSVKSRGIARDIFGTEENYVVPVNEMKDIHELTDAFCWISDREDEIRQHLKSFMPAYIEKAYAAGWEIAELFETGKDTLLKTKITKDACVGCGACASVCPAKCLQMKADAEGFLYPVVNEDLCIQCGLCAKVCPVKAQKTEQIPSLCLAAKNKNEKIRKQSSSGGVFTALAEKVLSEHGVVYGAALDQNCVVRHIEVQNSADLHRLRGAKYSQSVIGTCYQQAKDQLKAGRKVLFSGTPCQIAGLHSYLQKPYTNLVCVDIICHGAPSPAVWEQYLKGISPNGLPETVNFRSKDSGWSRYQYSMKAEYADGRVFQQKSGENVFLRGMTQDLYLRPACSSCKFKGFQHPGDITLGDFWGIWNQMPDFDDNQGVSAVIVNSTAGQKLIEACSGTFDTRVVQLADIQKENPSWQKSSPFTQYRSVFFIEFLKKKNVEDAIQYAEKQKAPKKNILDTLSQMKHTLLRR